MAQGQGYVYTINHLRIVVSTAISIIQIKAISCPLELLRATLTQHLSITSAMAQIAILRKTAAATVTSFTPLKYNSNDPTALAAGGTAATGITATAEGTDGDVLVEEAFNVLNPWIWTPVDDRIVVDPTTTPAFLALKFTVAPASATWTARMVFRELRG